MTRFEEVLQNLLREGDWRHEEFKEEVRRAGDFLLGVDRARVSAPINPLDQEGHRHWAEDGLVVRDDELIVLTGVSLFQYPDGSDNLFLEGWSYLTQVGEKPEYFDDWEIGSPSLLKARGKADEVETLRRWWKLFPEDWRKVCPQKG